MRNRGPRGLAPSTPHFYRVADPSPALCAKYPTDRPTFPGLECGECGTDRPTLSPGTECGTDRPTLSPGTFTFTFTSKARGRQASEARPHDGSVRALAVGLARV